MYNLGKDYEEKENEEITRFVRRCTEIYLSKEEKEQEEEMSFRIAKTVKRWEERILFSMTWNYMPVFNWTSVI